MKENKARIELAVKVIKDTIKISDLFKEYRRFKDEIYRGEGDWMIPCPFHNDASPSLGVNDGLGFFNCFGCSAKGNAVNALMWLARTVDYTSYSYAGAIDQLIKRYPLLRESLPFDTVFDKTISISEVISRPRLRHSTVPENLKKTMKDVHMYMIKNGKNSFMDIAYATSMMVGRQEPDQILAFLGSQNVVNTQKVEETAADLLAALDDWEA